VKKLLTILAISLIGWQLAAQHDKVLPPQIGTGISLGGQIAIEGYTIGFEQVVEDSRCPTNVDCVWAGQAVVKVSIGSPDGTQQLKELSFKAGYQDKKQFPIIVTTEGFSIRALALKPYPEDPGVPMEYKLVVARVGGDQ
jgi:hypothetical protein